MTRSRRSVVVDGGRTLCFAEWCDPAGFPVFGLHGTPGGRLNRHPDDGKYAEAGARVISAYLTADRDLEALVLRRALADRLPPALIPARFVQVDAMPLTSHGKIDKRALRAAGARQA